jgi:peptidyl-prolyl cis-trans isomerase C
MTISSSFLLRDPTRINNMKQSFSIIGVLSTVSILWIAALALTSSSSDLVDAFTTVGRSSLVPRTTNTRLYFNGDLTSVFRNWGKKCTVSHILIGPESSKTGRGMLKDDATKKLLELKEEINDDFEKFAEIATDYSSCNTYKVGGAMEPFSAGLMFKTFDKIAFEEEVGKVHGPFSTPYGEHIVLIRERTE